MAISVNWITKVIFIPKADTTLVQSSPTEIRELDLNVFRLALRDLEDDPLGRPYQRTHDHNTTVSISGIELARVITILDPYTITFEDGQYAVNLIGANSNVGDKVNVNQVSVRSANSAGLVQTKEIQRSAFTNSAVWLNAVSGVAGQIYPIGTPGVPVNNITDAKFIAAFYGFDTIHVSGAYLIEATDNLDQLKIVGDGITRSALTFTSGCSTSNTFFQDALMTGTVDGSISATTCYMKNLYGVGCTTFPQTFTNCSLEGVIQLRFDNIVDTHFIDCVSGVASAEIPIVDLLNTTTSIDFRDYIGGLHLINSNNATSNISVDLEGHINLDSTISDANSVVVRGRGKITNNATINVAKIDTENFLEASALQRSIDKTNYIGKDGTGVTIDSIAGIDSNEIGIGTREFPCKTEQNLQDISAELGFKKVYLVNNLTITQDHSVDPHDFYGDNPSTINVNCDPLSNVSGCRFYDAYVTGALNANIVLWESVVGSVSNSTGFVYFSACIGPIVVGSGTLNIINSWENNSGNPFVLDMSNINSNLSIKGFEGIIEITNVTDPTQVIDISMTSGEVIVAASCTANNSIKLKGTAKLTNNSSAVINASELVDLEDLRLIKFDNAIWYDETNGTTGQSDDHGAPNLPVNNWTDALALNTRYGFNKIRVRGAATVDQSISNITIEAADVFVGKNSWNTETFNINGNVLTRVILRNLVTTGDMTGSSDIEFDGCYQINLTGITGESKNCRLDGTLTLEAGGYWSGVGSVVEGSETTVSLNNSATAEFSHDVQSGYIFFTDMVPGALQEDLGSYVNLNLRGGEIEFDDTVLNGGTGTVTGGTIYIEGYGYLYNGIDGISTVEDLGITIDNNH